LRYGIYLTEATKALLSYVTLQTDDVMSHQKEKTGIREIARLAGVSTATVSRALNNPQSVSEELRQRIRSVVDQAGYVPHGMARALSSNRTRTIGAIIPTIDNAMFARGIEALQKYLSSRGYMLILATNGYDVDVELEQARNLVSRGVDGLILRGDCHHPALRDLLVSRDIPSINVGVYHPNDDLEASASTTKRPAMRPAREQRPRLRQDAARTLATSLNVPYLSSMVLEVLHASRAYRAGKADSRSLRVPAP
jgi:hypothetical protein